MKIVKSILINNIKKHRTKEFKLYKLTQYNNFQNVILIIQNKIKYII